MKRFLLIFLVMFAAEKTISQDLQMVRHEVKLGETVKMLSKKYHVPPAEIYKLNKFAVEGISEGMILQIPAERKYAEAARADAGYLPDPPADATKGAKKIKHKVEAGETLSGISAKYKVPMEKIKASNPALEKGLQAGQVITIVDSD